MVVHWFRIIEIDVAAPDLVIDTMNKKVLLPFLEGDNAGILIIDTNR